MSRPDLIWNSLPAERKDRIKAFVLIGSWTVSLILLGVAMLYG